MKTPIQVGIRFNSGDFSRGDGWINFQQAANISIDNVMDVISNIYQSNSVGLNTQTFGISVTTVRLPVGGIGPRGRIYNTFDEECARRKGIITINNKDNLCLPRALVVAIAKVEKDPEWVKVIIYIFLTLSLTVGKKSEDEERPYEFGFTIDGQQHRHEKKDQNGIIQGEFGFITADGVYHVTVYATDENGDFKILSMRNIRISAPLDGSPATGPISPEAGKYLGKQSPASSPPAPSQPIQKSGKIPELPAAQQPTTTNKPNKKYPFTTQPTIKPACGGCGYVTTPKPIPGQPFQFQNPAFQKASSAPQNPNLVVTNQQQSQNFGDLSQNVNANNQPAAPIVKPVPEGPPSLGSGNQFGRPVQESNQPAPDAGLSPPGDQEAGIVSSPELQQQNLANAPNYQSQQQNQQNNQQPYQQYLQITQNGNSKPEGLEQNKPNAQNYQNQQPQNFVGSLSPQNNQGYPPNGEAQEYQSHQGLAKAPITGQNRPLSKDISDNQNEIGQIINSIDQIQSGGLTPNRGTQGSTVLQGGLNIKDQNAPPFSNGPNPLLQPQDLPKLPPVSVSDNVIHVGGKNPKDIPIKDKYPGMVDGLPAGVEDTDVKDILYKFKYTVGFHGHYEKGLKNGAKVGGYFVNGRDGYSRVVTYIADENGYRPKFKLINLGLDSPDTPKEGTEDLWIERV